MRRLFVASLVWVVSLVMAWAAPVSEQAARQAAMDFVRQQWPALTRGGAVELTRADIEVADGEKPGIFVFNSQKGYVVISGDDELPAVLAYGNGATYDYRTASPALNALLEAYNEAIATKSLTRADVPTHADIAPMVKTKWDQDAPYNAQCPNQYPTGCVATAMAQVMYYHRWPASYDWGKMKTSYGESDTGAAADAVAKLMADCGDKVFMKYAEGSSSAANREPSEALRYDFGYAETTEYVERFLFTNKAWDALIYGELKAKRPVMYFGQSVSSGKGESGHAFVVDGYEAKGGLGYYHVNWGWGGSSDDYFLLSSLNPRYQYTGGNAGSSGYSYSQCAVIGIQPAAEPMAYTTRLSVEEVSIKDDAGSYSRSSTAENFPAFGVKFSFFNTRKPEVERQYDLGLALYQDRKLVKMIFEHDTKEWCNQVYGTDGLPYNKGIAASVSGIAIGADLPDGTYQLRMMSRETGKSDWTWAQKAVQAYVEFNISGTKMTTTTYGNADYVAPSDFQINSVKVSDNPQVGRMMKITINLTDKNATNNSPVFLWGNASISAGSDTYQLLAGGGTNLEAGETGEVILDYTPQRAGEFTFVLSGSKNNCDTKLYTFTANVAEASQADVDISIGKVMADGAGEPTGKVRTVGGQRLKGTIALTNLGTETYDNDVQVCLLSNTKERGTYYLVKYQNASARIAVGQTAEIPYDFNDLESDLYYGIMVFALERGEWKALAEKLSYDVIFHLTGGSGISAVEAVGADADVYNLNGVRMGKASELESLPKGVYIINQKKIMKR